MPTTSHVGGNGVEQRAGARHGCRGQADVAVRHDVIVGEAVVELRLEHLHPLPGNLGAAHAANQLLALPAEHAAGYDFDPALVGPAADDVHPA